MEQYLPYRLGAIQFANYIALGHQFEISPQGSIEGGRQRLVQLRRHLELDPHYLLRLAVADS